MTGVHTAASAGRCAIGWQLRRQLTGVAYAIPTIAFIVVLFITPLLLVARMSGTSWPLLGRPGAINFPRNYTSIWHNRLFWPAVRFTVEYTILATVLLIGLGLALALIVQSPSRRVSLLRTVFLVPVSLGLAAASLLAYGFFSRESGPAWPLIERLGMGDSFSFFATPLAALLTTTFLIVWKFAGFYMLILLVGLQGIPEDVYEAGEIDGAGRWQTFRHITLPMLLPSLSLSLILCITGSLLAFDQFFILTKGGPDNSTVTVVQLIYREAFQRQNLGTAAALSIVVLIVLLLINAFQLRFLRRSEE